jgi:hypothetical protein
MEVRSEKARQMVTGSKIPPVVKDQMTCVVSETMITMETMENTREML